MKRMSDLGVRFVISTPSGPLDGVSAKKIFDRSRVDGVGTLNMSRHILSFNTIFDNSARKSM